MSAIVPHYPCLSSTEERLSRPISCSTPHATTPAQFLELGRHIGISFHDITIVPETDQHPLYILEIRRVRSSSKNELTVPFLGLDTKQIYHNTSRGDYLEDDGASLPIHTGFCCGALKVRAPAGSALMQIIPDQFRCHGKDSLSFATESCSKATSQSKSVRNGTRGIGPVSPSDAA